MATMIAGINGPYLMTDSRTRVKTNDSWETFIKMVFQRWLKTQPPVRPPQNTGLPFFLISEPSVGTTISDASINPGTWTNHPTFQYVLTKNDIRVDMPYTIVNEDVGAIFVATVIATNAGGSNTAETSPTPPTVGLLLAPANTTVPTINISQLYIGSIIAMTDLFLGDWTGNPTPSLSVQLRNDGDSVGLPYTVLVGDVGNTFDIVVTAVNSIGVSTALSVPTLPVLSQYYVPINLTAPVWNSAIYRVGDVIDGTDVNNGTWDANPAATLSNVLKVNAVTKTMPYTILVGDIGLTMVMQQTATNSEGTQMTPTVASSAIVAALAAPVNTVAPTLADTTPIVGDIITTSGITNGTWTGNPTPTLTKSLEVGGVVKFMPYTVVTADIGATVVGKVTGTNTQGTATGSTAASSAITAPLTAPANVTLPSLADTTPTVGDVITAASINQGTWSGNPVPTLSNQLKVNGVNKSLPYTVVSGDIGLTITVTVTGTNSQGSNNATSTATSAVVAAPSAPTVITPPSWVDNTFVVGEVIDATDWNVGTYGGNPAPTLTYQLARVGGLDLGIPYTVVAGDVGSRVWMKVVATNASGSIAVGTPDSAFITAGGSAPVNTAIPFFTDTTPTVGDVINNASINQGTWTGSPTPTFSNQFKKNGSNITVPYTVVSGDAGATFSVTVTATNTNGSAQASSNNTSPVQGAAPAGSLAAVDWDVTPSRNYYTGAGAGIELYWAGRTWGWNSAYKDWNFSAIDNNEVRTEVRQGDRMVDAFPDSVGIERDKFEMLPKLAPTRDILVQGKIFFEDFGTNYTGNFFVLSELHTFYSSGSGLAAKFELIVRNNCWGITSNFNSTTRALWENILTVVRNTWHTIMYFVRSNATQGRVVFDLNGTRYVNFTGQVGMTNESEYNPQWGIYRGTNITQTWAVRWKDFSFVDGAYNTLTIPAVGGGGTPTYGPDKYLNGDYPNTTGLVAGSSTLAIDTGRLRVTSTIASGNINANKFITGLTIGKSYRVKGQAQRGTCVQCYLLAYSDVGGQLGVSAMVTNNAAMVDIEFNFTADATNITIYNHTECTAIGQTGFFDNVTLQEVIPA